VMMRLLTLIGYPMEEIVQTITSQFGVTDEEARDLYAHVTEQTLSADEQAANL
jgi:hypothetical protein